MICRSRLSSDSNAVSTRRSRLRWLADVDFKTRMVYGKMFMSGHGYYLTATDRHFRETPDPSSPCIQQHPPTTTLLVDVIHLRRTSELVNLLYCEPVPMMASKEGEVLAKMLADWR